MVKRAEYLQIRLKTTTFASMLRTIHIASQHLSVSLGGGNSLVYNNLSNNIGVLSIGAVRHNRILL